MTTTILEAPTGAFSGLQPQPADPLLSLIRAYAEDPRPEKIDLGVGVYRDAVGHTPVFAAIKDAEARLLVEQETKGYLGPEGDLEFLDLLRPLVFGEGRAAADLIALQTPGGTGALRLAAALAKAADPAARVWLGTPSWPIHTQIFAAAGLHVETFRYFDAKAQGADVAELLAALNRAAPGDLFLLHGCCHNPSGADLSLEQWRAVAELVGRRGVIPLVDLAYQGLGEGLEADAAGVRLIFAAADQAILAYSCDKNFGLYRERTGALFVRARGRTEVVRSNLLALARCLWSMPPDHGAAAVRLVLASAERTHVWRHELDAMRGRLQAVRAGLAEADPRLAPLGRQNGLFALLPLNPDEVARMRTEFAVYMAGSGRINVAGLTPDTLRRFTQAFAACLS